MKRATVIRLVLLVVLVAAGSAAVWFLPLREWAPPVLDWVHGLGVLGLVILAAAYTPAGVFGFPPAWLLTMAAGVVYGDSLAGVFAAVGAVSLGSTFAATVAFLLGRTLARDWVAARVSHRPLFRALDAAVAEQGFKVVLLTRLSPLFPFVLLNYAYGLTKVKLRDYVLATWIGMLPGTLLYVYIGSTLGNVAALFGDQPRQKTPLEIALYCIGLAATVAVTVLVSWQARRALQRTLKSSEGEEARPAPPGEPHV